MIQKEYLIGVKTTPLNNFNVILPFSHNWFCDSISTKLSSPNPKR